MYELPCSLLSHMQPHEAIRKQECTANRLFYYFTGVKHALIAFKPRRTEQKKEDRASPWIQKVNLLTAAFPKLFASSLASKASAFSSVGSTLVWLSSKVSCSKLKSPCRVWKKTSKTHPTSAMRTELYFLLRNWARTSIKPVNLRVRLLIQDQHLTEGDERENKRCTLPRFVWPHWPITRLDPVTRVAWNFNLPGLARASLPGMFSKILVNLSSFLIFQLSGNFRYG